MTISIVMRQAALMLSIFMIGRSFSRANTNWAERHKQHLKGSWAEMNGKLQEPVWPWPDARKTESSSSSEAHTTDESESQIKQVEYSLIFIAFKFETLPRSTYSHKIFQRIMGQ